MKRENFSQLPNSTELKDILETESKMELPEGKETAHYFDFSSLERLAAHFDIDAQVITTDYSENDVTKKNLLEEGKFFIQELKNKILETKLTEEDIAVLNDVYDYLSQEDIPEKSDFIFVFGAKTPLRIEKAIDLYKQRISDKILVSGRSPHYAGETNKTEAEIYSQIAIEAGVPEESIIMENGSITIPDNVRSSLNLLDEKKFEYSSITLVNSPYTQRRGYAHFKKYLPDDVKITRVNSETGELYRRDSWYGNDSGISVVLGEFMKAKIAVSLNTA